MLKIFNRLSGKNWTVHNGVKSHIPLELPISENITDPAEQKIFADAIRLISQTPTGRHLIQHASKTLVTIDIDRKLDDVLGGKTQDAWPVVKKLELARFEESVV